MEKVTFSFNSGRQRLMSERDAKLLAKLGKGSYLTRDMAAAGRLHAPFERGEELDSMGLEQLHALAKERGVKVHHKAGADKVRAAIREASL